MAVLVCLIPTVSAETALEQGAAQYNFSDGTVSISDASYLDGVTGEYIPVQEIQMNIADMDLDEEYIAKLSLRAQSCMLLGGAQTLWSTCPTDADLKNIIGQKLAYQKTIILSSDEFSGNPDKTFMDGGYPVWWEDGYAISAYQDDESGYYYAVIIVNDLGDLESEESKEAAIQKTAEYCVANNLPYRDSALNRESYEISLSATVDALEKCRNGKDVVWGMDNLGFIDSFLLPAVVYDEHSNQQQKDAALCEMSLEYSFVELPLTLSPSDMALA